MRWRSELTCTRASLKQAPPPMIGERVGHERRAGDVVARAAPPDALRQADRAGTNRRRHRQRAMHFAELVEDPHQIARPPARAPRASSGCISSLTSGRGSSPSVELIVRSLAGEMSASG